MDSMKSMQIGQIVDFCIAYNERHKETEEESDKGSKKSVKKKKRLATQAEIDAFLG